MTHNQEDDRPPLRKGSLSVRTRLIGSRRYPGWLSHEFILDPRAYGSDTSMTLTHFSAVQIVYGQQGGRCAITLSFCLAPGSTVFWSPIPHYMYVAQDGPGSWSCRGSDRLTQELRSGEETQYIHPVCRRTPSEWESNSSRRD